MGTFITGFFIFFILRYIFTAFYVVDQNERAVKTIFGRAERFGNATTLDDPISASLRPDEKPRYAYPKVKIIPPGGPYVKWPWEKIYKVSVATQTLNMAFDPDVPSANKGGRILEAVTKDQLNTGLIGQMRFRVSEKNLYAYLFGIRSPLSHIMGYFVAVLRERIANFEGLRTPVEGAAVNPADVIGVSINDLRKNLRLLNEQMAKECASSEARYGIVLDASLITGIEPPNEVESALAAINTAHNHVSSDISLAQAQADQTIVQSRKAVEIETLKAQAEVEPLIQMANQLKELKGQDGDALDLYTKNIRLELYKKSDRVVVEVSR